MATVFVWSAAGGVLATAALVVVVVVLPQWRDAVGEFAITLNGSLWLATVILFAVAGVALCFLVRAFVFFRLEPARNLQKLS